eukprot:4418662-Prymnesium_polylepis.1
MCCACSLSRVCFPCAARVPCRESASHVLRVFRVAQPPSLRSTGHKRGSPRVPLLLTTDY